MLYSTDQTAWSRLTWMGVFSVLDREVGTKCLVTRVAPALNLVRERGIGSPGGPRSVQVPIDLP